MDNRFMWTTLVHLGSNMWNEEGNLRYRGENRSNRDASPVLRFERNVWDQYMLDLKANGTNTIVLDVGEALFYESHPELAVAGSWSHDRMRAELAKLRAMGFEVIPKVNFSASHDTWLKDYSRMLTTPIYHQVCKDVIDEICDVFDTKYVHIGMDEETASHQRALDVAVIRQYDAWWKDLYHLVKCVESNNARAWVWSDYGYDRIDEYMAKMPKTVVQNVWWYHESETLQVEEYNAIKAIDLLDQNGYDIVPAASVWKRRDNAQILMEYAADHISDEHFYGFMQTTWERPAHGWEHVLKVGNETMSEVKTWYENR